MNRTIVHLQVPDLFGTTPPMPNGFTYKNNFISEFQERTLLLEIEKIPLGHLTIQGMPSKRRIKSFGLNYSFLTRQLSQGEPIPEFLLPLREQVARLTEKNPEDFSEVLLTEYQPGAGITWHCDAPPFDLIVGVSLLGSCVLKLRPIENHGNPLPIPLQPRSAYILDGQAREQWQHHIPPTKTLRYSITFRNVRKRPY